GLAFVDGLVEACRLGPGIHRGRLFWVEADDPRTVDTRDDTGPGSPGVDAPQHTAALGRYQEDRWMRRGGRDRPHRPVRRPGLLRARRGPARVGPACGSES